MGFILGLLGAKTPHAQQQAAVSGLQLQSSAFGKAIPIVYGTTRIAPNLIDYDDFLATQQQSNGGGGGGKGGVGGGGGGKGGGGSTGYVYSTTVLLGISEGPIQGIGAAYVDKNATTPAALGMSIFTGTYPQAPWGFMTTNHPSKALGYNGVSYLAASAYSLGNSPQLPNHNFEVKGIYSTSVGALEDADPSLVVVDLTSNAHYGAGFPSAKWGDLTQYQNYTLATGLLISPAYQEQADCASLLKDIADNTNSEYVWSSGKLTLVPYGDKAITGNGKTYTPPSTPLYDVGDDDFIWKDAETDPVICTRMRPADALNSIKLEYLDRTNAYNSAIADAKDQAAIDTFGLRQQPSKQAHLFCDAAAAKTSVQLQLQRQAVRNIYSFTLDQRYILLDPMDIITITDSVLGLNRQWVRINDITENDDGTLDFTAEEYLDGTGNSATYSFQQGSGFNANYNSAPGNANTPIIFEPPVQLTDTGLETWIAASGGTNWGGCDVWVSSDNNSYRLAGRINGPSRMGSLTSSFASGSDPDTANTLAVDLTQSRGVLTSGTQNDADLAHTLCYVDGEYVSYEIATLTATYKYNLGTYLRRGLFGSTIASHASSTKFARLDDGIFKFSFDKSQVGQTVYIKLLSFNIYGGGEQQLSDVSPYTHIVTGPPVPSDVTNFSVEQNGNVVVFKWDDIPEDVGLKGYDIGYAVSGATNWADFLPLTEAARGTEMTNAAVPPGTWRFGIRARDIADQLSANIAYADFTVVNENSEIYQIDEAPNFGGVLVNMVRHWTGKIVPDSQFAASHYSNYDVFDKFVPDPVASCSYTTAIIDTGFDDLLRIFSVIGSADGPGESGTPNPQFQIDTWLTSQSDPNIFTNWSIGNVNMRYLRARVLIAPVATHVFYLSSFIPNADRAPSVQQADSVVIAPGGTTVTFAAPFHTAPFVQGTAVSASGLFVSVTNITATQATFHVWNTSGSDVGGTINYTASGT